MTVRLLAFAGSTRAGSLNQALLDLAVAEARGRGAEVTEIRLKDFDLPLYDADLERAGFPVAARELRELFFAHHGVLIASPEYNGSVTGVLKNAIDWASRPWGQNSFDHVPAAVIGATPGQLGTALAQQSLRGVLSYCNARQMTSPEAYITFKQDVFSEDGEVRDESTREFLTTFMSEFRDHIARVLTVLPRD